MDGESAGGVSLNGSFETGKDILDKEIRFYDTAGRMTFIETRLMEMHNAGFTVLHWMADPLVASMQCANCCWKAR